MTMNKFDLRVFSDPEELADNLAARVAGLLQKGINDRGTAALVVSGGSTPGPLFESLSHQEIDWPRVTITLADERWVDTLDNDSNERLVRDVLLQGRAGAACFIGLKNPAPTALEGEQECGERLAAVVRPFDVVILGMGNDGHTASFFPGAERLPEALDLNSGQDCLAVIPPSATHGRMTLSLPALLSSRQIILHITGRDKKTVLDLAVTDGPERDMPIRAILRQQQTPLSVYWAPWPMSIPAEEIVQIVDEDNREIAAVARRIMRAQKLIHRATYILVFNRASELFIQKRTMSKDIYPGYWEVAAGGVVQAGESYETSAQRELAEELGIRGIILTPCFDQFYEDQENRVWGRIFRCTHDGPFVLQKEEVAYGRFVTVDKALRLSTQEPFTPDGIKVLKRLREDKSPQV